MKIVYTLGFYPGLSKICIDSFIRKLVFYFIYPHSRNNPSNKDILNLRYISHEGNKSIVVLLYVDGFHQIFRHRPLGALQVCRASGELIDKFEEVRLHNTRFVVSMYELNCIILNVVFFITLEIFERHVTIDLVRRCKLSEN